MIDSEMKYCTACDDEYMPEIVNCGVCGARLISGAELMLKKEARQQRLDSRRGELTVDDDIVTILRAPMADIKRVGAQLGRENIGTLIFGEDPSCGKGCCGGGTFELKVRREEAQLALAIIESDFDRTTAINEHNTAYVDYGFDPEEGENTCPACGCTFTTDSVTCPDCGLCFG